MAWVSFQNWGKEQQMYTKGWNTMKPLIFTVSPWNEIVDGANHQVWQHLKHRRFFGQTVWEDLTRTHFLSKIDVIFLSLRLRLPKLRPRNHSTIHKMRQSRPRLCCKVQDRQVSDILKSEVYTCSNLPAWTATRKISAVLKVLFPGQP